FSRDWSSDVCSSDLFAGLELSVLELQHVAVFLHGALQSIVEPGGRFGLDLDGDLHLDAGAHGELLNDLVDQIGELLLRQERVERSEERRVGKEWRAS